VPVLTGLQAGHEAGALWARNERLASSVDWFPPNPGTLWVPYPSDPMVA